jgi:Porin PorA
MRRAMGLALVALGAFAIVIGLMSRWYLAPHATKAPLEESTVVDAVSDGNSSILDKGTLTMRHGVTLTTHRRIQGDRPAGTDGVAVWNQFSYTQDADGKLVQATLDRMPFDRVSGMLLNCCGAATEGKPVTRSGLYFKFPFDTRRVDYPFFDEDTGHAWPAVYRGEEERLGLTLYTFRMQVPATDLETIDVPPSLVNRPGGGSVTVHRYVESTTDLGVEPVTGSIITATSHSVQTLRDASGAVLSTVADVTSSLTEATQRQSADLTRDGLTQLTLVRTIVPIVSVVLGLAAIVAGLVVLGVLSAVRGRRFASPRAPLSVRRRRAAV